MAISAAPVEESMAILHVALSRIDLTLLAILRHAVPFEVTQVRVHCLGADKQPSAGGPALRVSVAQACRRHGVATSMIFRWRVDFGPTAPKVPACRKNRHQHRTRVGLACTTTDKRIARFSRNEEKLRSVT
jgi:hypothetical protein